MAPELLRAAGQALHGEFWRVPLAADLGVSHRTVRRWAEGEFRMPEGLSGRLAALLSARGVVLRELAERLAA